MWGSRESDSDIQVGQEPDQMQGLVASLNASCHRKKKNIKLELCANIVICFGFEVKKYTTLGRLSGSVC